MEKKKILHLEIIRIIAAFLVIYNHTGYDGYFYPERAQNGVEFTFALVLSLLCKVAVPLFFMVSGALLLGKQESIRMVLKKRVLRIAIILPLISFLYYLARVLVERVPFSAGEFFSQLYTGYVLNNLWFLYAYLAFTLALPLLRRIAVHIGGMEFLYLLVLKLLLEVTSSIIGAATGLQLNGYLAGFYLITDAVFYPLAGYYFVHRLADKRFTHKNAWLAALAGCVGLMVGCLLTWTSYVKEGIYSDVFHLPFAILPTLAVFFIIQMACRERQFGVRAAWWITLIGGCAFGIYLFEPFFRNLLYRVYTGLSPLITPLPAALVWVLTVFVGSGLLTLLLKRIPLVRKLL